MRSFRSTAQCGSTAPSTTIAFGGDGNPHHSRRGQRRRPRPLAMADALITGRLNGDIVALDGRITTRDGAVVTGSVKSRQEPDVAPGTVQGDVKKLNIKNLWAGFVILFLIYLWIAVTLAKLRAARAPVRAAVPSCGRRHHNRKDGGSGHRSDGERSSASWGRSSRCWCWSRSSASRSGSGCSRPSQRAGAARLRRELAHPGSLHGEEREHRRRGSAPSSPAFGILRAVALIPGIGTIAWFLVCVYGLNARPGRLAQAGMSRRGSPPPEPPPAAPPVCAVRRGPADVDAGKG